MEIRTCEEYVLSKLTETEEKLSQAIDANAEFRDLLITIQRCLEVFIDIDGEITVEVDKFAINDETKKILGSFLGRGKYPDTDINVDADSDADAEENVEA